MAIAILKTWRTYFDVSRHEGLGSSYERVVLNRKLDAIRRQYDVETVLEAPSFGFTGLSGINSMGLAKRGVAISLLDHDRERAECIQRVWNEAGLPLNLGVVDRYDPLPFTTRAFDMSWNFASLWFVESLDRFLSELDRVTSKVIVIGVPNRTALGYLLEKAVSGVVLPATVREAHLVPRTIATLMKQYGWVLVEHSYLDAPPWPDIGMKKEDFLRVLGLAWLAKGAEGPAPRPLTVMDYYSGTDPLFEDKMLRYFWWERIAPRPIKFIWAHHRILRFERRKR